MEIWLMGIGSTLIAAAFGLFVHASDVSSSNNSGGISWHTFAWLSLMSLILGFVSYGWAAVIIRRRESKLRQEADDRENREIERDEREKERFEMWRMSQQVSSPYTARSADEVRKQNQKTGDSGDAKT